jgi:protein TonB
VVLHAIIATDGTIKELQPIGKPHPMLLPAAMAAVRTWRYKPQTLNDEPVEVDLEITINFTLN